MSFFDAALHRVLGRKTGVSQGRRERTKSRASLQFIVCAAALMASAASLAANYPLELVSPRAVGSSPSSGMPAITASNRIFKAYPGLEYNIRAAVIGGAYPFTYSLSNAPSGMTIDPQTGTITWPNPQQSASATITVRDAEGTQVSSTWQINVTTEGFRFVDATNGRNASANGCSSSCGTGTASNPWRSLKDVGTAGAPGEIVYFRAGTYRVTDMSRDNRGDIWECVVFHGSQRPVVWLAYPGETPIIDFAYQPGVEHGPMIRFTGSNVWVDGFETRRSHIMGFQFTSGPSEHYRTVRRVNMHDHAQPGENNNGSNASFIMTTQSYNNQSRYMVIQDSEFSRAPMDVTLKIYSQTKILIENNSIHDSLAGMELKADIPHLTVRGNTLNNIGRIGIGGNMDEGTTYGEIAFNLVRNAGEMTLDVNQNSTARRLDIYRNTFVGRVRVRNTDSQDGPFNFYNNVIINGDGGNKLYYESVSAPQVITVRDNLTGTSSSGIVDSNGRLASSYRQYVGTRGFETGNVVIPQPPSALRVE